MLGDVFTLLAYAKLFISLIVLGVLGIQDLRSRNISPHIVYVYVGFSISIFIVSSIITPLNSILKIFYSFISLLVTLGAFTLLYMYNLVGDGDVYVSSAIGLCFSYPDIYDVTLIKHGTLPPSLVILLYSSVVPAIYMLVNLVVNIIKHIDKIHETPSWYRVVFPLIARPVRIRDYLEGGLRNHYPLEIFELDERKGRLNRYFTISSSLSEDLEKRIRDLVSKGLISENQYIWVTYGLPMVFLMFIGLIVFIAVGDKPVLMLLDNLLR